VIREAHACRVISAEGLALVPLPGIPLEVGAKVLEDRLLVDVLQVRCVQPLPVEAAPEIHVGSAPGRDPRSLSAIAKGAGREGHARHGVAPDMAAVGDGEDLVCLEQLVDRLPSAGGNAGDDQVLVRGDAYVPLVDPGHLAEPGHGRRGIPGISPAYHPG